MKEIKNKLKLFILSVLIGLTILILGFINANPTVIGFGAGVFILSTLKCIQLYQISKDKEKINEYINLTHDERMRYINEKAYSTAFWITLYLEFVALSIFSLIGLQLFAAILGCTFSFKLIIYLLLNIYFSKKYWPFLLHLTDHKVYFFAKK